MSGGEEDLLVVLEIWVSWGVVNDDASGLDIIVDTVFGVFHKVDEVLDVSDTEEKVVTLLSNAVGIVSKFRSKFNKVGSLVLIFVKDSDFVAGSGQEESKLMSGLTETNPADLPLLVVFDDLHAILLNPVWELEWLSVFHEVVPVVFGFFILQSSWSNWDILFEILFFDLFLELCRRCAHHINTGSCERLVVRHVGNGERLGTAAHLHCHS